MQGVRWRDQHYVPPAHAGSPLHRVQLLLLREPVIVRGATFKTCAIALATLLFSACSGGGRGKAANQTQGDLQASPSPAGASRCTLPGSQGTPACDACLEKSCCAELSACTANAECSAVFGCLSACAERPEPDVCPGRCFGNGAPPALFESFLECMIGSCELECTELSAG